jgi:hypothetical protein
MPTFGVRRESPLWFFHFLALPRVSASPVGRGLAVTAHTTGLQKEKTKAAILAALQNEDRGLPRPIYDIGRVAASIWRCPGP